MNILGTMYLADNVDFVRNTIMNPNRFTICMDTDETDNILEEQFPNNCQKSTILCVPPKVIYMEIDGDHEGFIREYNLYLESPDVTEFIAGMLAHMHRGYNHDILIYIPDFSEDSVWVNVLMTNIFSRFGITIGTSAQNSFKYDPTYDNVVADTMYMYGYTDIYDYTASTTHDVPPYALINKVRYDLAPYTEPGHDPIETFNQIKMYQNTLGVPIIGSAIQMIQ